MRVKFIATLGCLAVLGAASIALPAAADEPDLPDWYSTAPDAPYSGDFSGAAEIVRTAPEDDDDTLEVKAWAPTSQKHDGPDVLISGGSSSDGKLTINFAGIHNLAIALGTDFTEGTVFDGASKTDTYQVVPSKNVTFDGDGSFTATAPHADCSTSLMEALSDTQLDLSMLGANGHKYWVRVIASFSETGEQWQQDCATSSPTPPAASTPSEPGTSTTESLRSTETGDETNPLPWVLLVIALLVIVALVRSRKQTATPADE